MTTKLTDENPYDILGIPVNANRKMITRAFAEKNHGNNEDRRLARQAYDALRKPEERLKVDALTPTFSHDYQELFYGSGI